MSTRLSQGLIEEVCIDSVVTGPIEEVCIDSVVTGPIEEVLYRLGCHRSY